MCEAVSGEATVKPPREETGRHAEPPKLLLLTRGAVLRQSCGKSDPGAGAERPGRLRQRVGGKGPAVG